MPRKYIKKTTRTEISEEAIKSAVQDVIRKLETPTSAALKYNLKRTTIITRIKKKQNTHGTDSGQSTDDESNYYSSKYTSNQIFTQNQETELAEYFKKCSLLKYGLTYLSARKFAFQYAEINNIKCPTRWKSDQIAGVDWMYGFMKRNGNLSLRKPENTSIARASGFNKIVVAEFFENLTNLLKKHNFEAKDIYNLDETGLTTVLQAPKVISEKGKRTVSQVVSAERGSLVTVIGIINASGNYIPPVFIYPRKRNIEKYLVGGLNGCIALSSKSGWMISDLFTDVLKHIVHHSKCSKEKPILLLLDNHSSHCSLDAIIYCRDNGIILLSFPPHTSHRLQPLDVSVVGPFKTYCKTSFNDYLTNNPGKVVTIFEIAQLSKLPFQRAFTSENIEKSFRSTGIYPLNTKIFPEEEFSLHEHTREQPTVVTDLEETSNPSPSTKNTEYVTPDRLRPLPKISAPKSKKGGKSRIYTDTPEKDRLMELERNRNMKKATAERKQAAKKFKKAEFYSSDSAESETFSVADTDDSIGPLHEALSDFDDIDDDYSQTDQFKLCDQDTIKLGDFVLAKFKCKTGDKFYIGCIIEDNPEQGNYTADFLRRKSSTTFYKPTVPDIAIILRDEIELKLPAPIHPPGTSRSSTMYNFNIDLSGYNVS